MPTCLRAIAVAMVTLALTSSPAVSQKANSSPTMAEDVAAQAAWIRAFNAMLGELSAYVGRMPEPPNELTKQSFAEWLGAAESWYFETSYVRTAVQAKIMAMPPPPAVMSAENYWLRAYKDREHATTDIYNNVLLPYRALLNTSGQREDETILKARDLYFNSRARTLTKDAEEYMREAESISDDQPQRYAYRAAAARNLVMATILRLRREAQDGESAPRTETVSFLREQAAALRSASMDGNWATRMNIIEVTQGGPYEPADEILRHRSKIALETYYQQFANIAVMALEVDRLATDLEGSQPIKDLLPGINTRRSALVVLQKQNDKLSDVSLRMFEGSVSAP